MRERMSDVSAALLAVVIVAAIIIVTAIGGIVWTRTIGVAQKDAEREAYKATMTYNEGMLDDLAKYKFQYDSAEDDVERAAIAELVRNRFANFDKSRIENQDLIKFLEDCGV